MSQASSPTNLAQWYVPLVILACAGSLQALILPRWPRATDLAGESIKTALQRSGFNPVSLAPLPPRRSYDLASSAVLGYKLAGGEELRLVDITVRERHKFEMNRISSDHQPTVRLEDAKNSQQPPVSSLGRIQGDIARQTCLVPGMKGSEGFAVTQEQLWRAVDSVAHENARESLQRVIGLGSKRSYRCVLITLQARPGMAIPEARWHDLLHVLQPALENGIPPTSAQHSSLAPSRSWVLAQPNPPLENLRHG
jgi:hypothetical protein